MKTILETTQLEYSKSDFLIDLVKQDQDKFFVEIRQTILNSNRRPESIKILPGVLTGIIKALQNYQAKMPVKSNFETKHLTDGDQKKIQDRYLKGISVEDIAMHFDQSCELIEMILRNRGIEIVSKKRAKTRKYRPTKYYRTS